MLTRFEVTVGGRLGPVFRAALQPCHVDQSRVWTILVTTGAEETDVTDLVGRLTSQGLSVEGVIAHDDPEQGDVEGPSRLPR
jgi:hypothetical protein